MHLLPSHGFCRVAVLVACCTASIWQARAAEPTLPLAPTDTLNFDVSEATWLSLALHPDGRTMLLEILGDLYSLPIGGGEATALTQGMPLDTQPAYSPDGERIAFLSDRGGTEALWIMRGDGSEAKQLGESKGDELFASPVFAPDGRSVYVSKSSYGLRTSEIWRYDVRGGSGVQVTQAKPTPDTPRAERANYLGVAPSADGQYLYFARRTSGFAYDAPFPMWELARLNLTTGEEHVVTQAPGSAMRPVLSPDGTRIVYATRFDAQTGLRIRDLLTGDDRWLTYPVQRDDKESRSTRDLLPGYAFTPDGRSLLFTHAGHIERLELATGTRTTVPFTAHVQLAVAKRAYFPQRVDDSDVRVRIVQAPRLSPDGKRVAFAAQARIYVMDANGGPPRALTNGAVPAFQPSWSPDGKDLVYVTWLQGEGHVWRVSAAGDNPRRLTTTPAFYAEPEFAPDGKRVVLLRAPTIERALIDVGTPDYRDLVWVPAGGGDVRVIAPAPGAAYPHFGPEPERIFLYVQGDVVNGGDHGLYSIRFDGTDRQDVLKVVAPGLFFAEEPVAVAEVRISPNGQYALARGAGQAYVMPLVRIGAKPVSVDVNEPVLPLQRLTHVGADYVSWSADSATVMWAIGPVLHRRALASIDFIDPNATDDIDGEQSADAAKTKAMEKPLVVAEAHEAVQTTTVDIRVPRARASGTLALVGGRAITMAGSAGAGVIDDSTVVVVDGRITAVGPRTTVQVPSDAHVIDVRGKTLLPGFIDTHAHYFEAPRNVLDLHSAPFLANLAYGVTTGLDVQPHTNDMSAYQDLIDAGAMIGPRAYSTGPGIFSDNQFASLDQAREVLRRYRDYYNVRNLKSYIAGNRQQRQWVTMAARELELMPTTEGALDLELNLTHAIDGFTGNEHALPIVPLYDDVVQLFARMKIGYTPTLLVAYGGPAGENFFYAKENVHEDAKLLRFSSHYYIDQRALRRNWFHDQEEVHQQLAQQAAKIIRAGGRVGVGAHGQLQGLGYHWELWALASGMTNEEALRAATLHGAEVIGLAQDLGSLEVGKLADVLVLNGDPLQDIRATNTLIQVIKGGVVYDADTLDEQWPSQKALGPIWWQGLAPQVSAERAR